MERLKNKGFTLVEILGVLVIIGILLLLIVPNVLKDVTNGKDEYNSKLKSQLEVVGKTYYSDHKNELPTSTSSKAYAYVTLPEMKSKNYIKNDFVDSEGNECSPSYVYVRQKGYNSSEYQYIPCLVCQDKKGNQYSYNDNAYCKISNWNDKEAPRCTNKTVDYNDNTVNKWNLSGVSDNIGIMAVIIRNTKTGDYKALDVSDMFKNADTDAKRQEAYNNIEQMYLRDEFNKYFDSNKRGNYEVVLLDFGGNESENSCLNFEIQVDECVGYREGSKITIETATSKYGFKELYYQVGDESAVRIKSGLSGKEIKDSIIDATSISHEAKLYYTDIKDNKIHCVVPEPGIPSCKFTKVPGSDHVGKSGTTIQASCTLCDGEICSNLVVADKNKITSKIGTISDIQMSPSTGKGRNIIFTFKYTPPMNQVGSDVITIGKGTVANSNDSTKVNYDSVTDLKYDTKAPTIIYGPVVGQLIQSTATNPAYAGTGYADSVSRMVTCVDEPTEPEGLSSGVKTLTVNGLNVNNPYNARFDTQGTYTLTATCQDFAGNSATSPGGTYRILKQIPQCNICGGTYAKCCTKHKKCCNKCKKVCTKYKTTTSYSYYWWMTCTRTEHGGGTSTSSGTVSSYNGKSCTASNYGSKGSMKKDNVTSCSLTCTRSSSTTKTCTQKERPSSCSQSNCESGHWGRHNSCSCESGYNKRDASCGWESCNTCWW